MVELLCLSARICNLPGRQVKLRSSYPNTKVPRTKEVGLDMLAKHLKRVALAREHVKKFQKYTGVGTGSVEGALVFSNSVPMIFEKQRIENSERHLIFDQLSSLYGSTTLLYVRRFLCG